MAILQVLADVFNSPVYTLEASNSAMLGSAYQAKYGLVHNNTSFADMTQHLPPPILACEPSKDADEVLFTLQWLPDIEPLLRILLTRDKLQR